MSPSARRSKCRPLTSTSFCTWARPVSVPDTVIDSPSGMAARSCTTLRWFGLSGAVVSSTSTPRSAARLGRVDERDLVLDDVREQPAQRGQLQHRDVLGGQLAGHVHGDRAGQPAGDRVEHGAQLLHQRQPRPDLLPDHAADLHVHRVRHELAGQRELHRAGHVGAGAVLRLVGGGAQVRRDDDLRQLEQRAGRWSAPRR